MNVYQLIERLQQITDEWHDGADFSVVAEGDDGGLKFYVDIDDVYADDRWKVVVLNERP